METENFLRISIPKRGLKVIPPKETREKMSLARQGVKVEPFSEEEKYRLRKLIGCKILEQRYPTKEKGKAFMVEVDLGWRNELLDKANRLAGKIGTEWDKIAPEIPIAILLYGSAAKGLTKRPNHPDPSNIDLAVLGQISPEERSALYDAIRPARQQIQAEILEKCPYIDSEESNPGNAGVSIQNVAKLTSNYYYGVRMYIQAGAFPLCDRGNIWSNLEQEAISFALSNTTPRGKSL